ncbi:hypothetical protein [Methylobacterium sp. SD274]|uniref:hypothetical protein n=1 Tax=Methylobacterium sp. SD274 TaxID=2782009 RepID=UPI001A969F73|nr:hypothetical protein [Methylobacterium sp. SD274]
MSDLEQAAFQTTFDPRMTIILGGNSTGKSSLIKSLYWILGADPARIHESWSNLKVTGLLEFEVDDTTFFMFRHGSIFGLFDDAGVLKESMQKVTSQLGPALAKLLGINLVLPDRKGKPTTPTPAFFFLPFYVDQDVGWERPWQSFNGLKQFAGYHRSIVSYHSGILPDEWFVRRAELQQITADKGELQSQATIVERSALALRQSVTQDALSIDQEEYEAAILRLLAELKKLREKRAKFASALSDAIAQRTLLNDQFEVGRRALKELEDDRQWLVERGDEDIPCPTCGTIHENSFAMKFGIIEDREACVAVLNELVDQIIEVKAQVEAARLNLRTVDEQVAAAQQVLTIKHGEITLAQVIASEGQRQALSVFDQQATEIEGNITDLTNQIEAVKKLIRKLENKTRKQKVEAFFAKQIRENLNLLDVKNVNLEKVQKIDYTIKDTGSVHPRAILSYVLAFVGTCFEHTTAITAPVILDSPLQQDQDPVNAKRIFSTIEAQRPANAQFIVGSVSLNGYEMSGKTIDLTEERKLLQPNLYSDVSALIDGFRRQMV